MPQRRVARRGAGTRERCQTRKPWSPLSTGGWWGVAPSSTAPLTAAIHVDDDARQVVDFGRGKHGCQCGHLLGRLDTAEGQLGSVERLLPPALVTEARLRPGLRERNNAIGHRSRWIDAEDAHIVAGGLGTQCVGEADECCIARRTANVVG